MIRNERKKEVNEWRMKIIISKKDKNRELIRIERTVRKERKQLNGVPRNARHLNENSMGITKVKRRKEWIE